MFDLHHVNRGSLGTLSETKGNQRCPSKRITSDRTYLYIYILPILLPNHSFKPAGPTGF